MPWYYAGHPWAPVKKWFEFDEPTGEKNMISTMDRLEKAHDEVLTAAAVAKALDERWKDANKALSLAQNTYTDLRDARVAEIAKEIVT